MARWWEQDMADASQMLYGDPGIALQVASAPNGVLNPNQLRDPKEIEKAEQVTRIAKGGFMDKIKATIGLVSGAIDDKASEIPGWGVGKNVATAVGSTLWYPVDKLASGAYWLYSNAVSQPLSTFILQSGKARQDDSWSTIFSADEWSDAYNKAEHTSPGQALMNQGLLDTAQGSIPFTDIDLPGEGVAEAARQINPDAQRQAERFLYDTEYWRNKVGWTYTAGTGATDFAISVGADPTYAGVKLGAQAVRGLKNIEVAGGQARRTVRGLQATPEEAAQKVDANGLYDWMDGRSGAEIAQHPVFGRGRRKNQHAEAYGEVYASIGRDERNLVTRFQLGEPAAMAQVGSKYQDLAVQLARMDDNRQLVDSVKFDPDMLGHFINEEQMMRVSQNLPAPSGAGRSPSDIQGRLIEPPYPRPVEPGPRQAGWDATYGHLDQEARIYRQAASEILKSKAAQQPRMFGGVAISDDDIIKANQWRQAKLQEMDIQIGNAYAKQKSYSILLGENAGKGIDEMSPASSELFGTSKTLYRQGILAGSSAKQGDKAVKKFASGRENWKIGTGGNVATRVIRNGFFRTPVRVVQSLNERIPQGFINHTDDDAGSRVMDMLKQVRGMAPEERLALVGEYSAQADKVGRSNALQSLHGAIIHHYARANNIDPAIAKEINDMTRNGVAATVAKLSGRPMTSNKYTSLTGAEMTTLSDEGEALVILPHMRTQLEQGEALLPVRELERFIDRHSGALQKYKQGMGSAADFMSGHADNLSRLWKASTLLRPGYTLRAVSEEAAASAVKFGMLARLGQLGEGGWNFMRNRPAEVKALVGKGSYVPTTGKGAGSALARVRIDDPNALAIAEKYGLQTERIRVSQAWPIVESRIKDEQNRIGNLDKEIDELKAAGEDITAKVADRDESQHILDEHLDYAKAILAEAKDATGRRLGEGTFTYRGEEIGEAFNAKAWENPIARDQISSSRAAEAIFARGEAIDMNRLIKTGSWTDVTPGAPNHMESWLRDINLQMRQDPLYRIMAQDETGKAARAWLKTPEGKHHVSQLGPWAREQDELLKVVKLTMDKYVPRGTGLQEKIAKNEDVFEAELRAAIKEEDFPVIHGEELRATLPKFSKETARHMTDKLISEGYERLAGIPSDLLNRHPVFAAAHKIRMKEAIDLHKDYRISRGLDESITPEELNRMYERAANQAKNDIRQVVYDPQRTTASEALRFINPFFTAHMDSLQRWSGLIAENPQKLIGISKIYNAPVAANLTTDMQGNHVGQDGYATVVTRDAEGKEVVERKFVPIDERVVSLRLPWEKEGQNKWAGKNIPFYDVPIKIQAINTILPGDPWFNPGTGPLVQFPASAIAKQSPQMGDFLQWAKVLPYGPNDSWHDAFTPKYIKEAYNAFTTDDPNNEKYQKAWLDVYNRKVAENFQSGKPVNLKEVEKEAKNFMMLQAFTAWASPAQTRETPLTGTPYQFYVDQYKKLQETDPKNASAIFQATYGEQYSHFTASMSKSIGVAPSIVAMTKAEELKDLIAMDPSRAAFIVGETYNGGGFSASVYRKQMETEMGGKPMREKTSALDAVRENQIQLGWNLYLKHKGQLDSILIQAGFRSYSDPGAEGFVAQRDALVQMIGNDHPAWFEERGKINTEKVPNNIAFFERVLADGRLQQDPMRFDIQGLAQYLVGRQQFKQALAARGAQQLSEEPGSPNADLTASWKMFQTSIVASNTQFGDVFNRYLEGDLLQ